MILWSLFKCWVLVSFLWYCSSFLILFIFPFGLYWYKAGCRWDFHYWWSLVRCGSLISLLGLQWYHTDCKREGHLLPAPLVVSMDIVDERMSHYCQVWVNVPNPRSDTTLTRVSRHFIAWGRCKSTLFINICWQECGWGQRFSVMCSQSRTLIV